MIPPKIVAASNSTTSALDVIDKHVPTDHAAKQIEINFIVRWETFKQTEKMLSFRDSEYLHVSQNPISKGVEAIS